MKYQAQSSMEMLILLGVGLLVLSIMFSITNESSDVMREQYRSSRLEVSLKKLVEAADVVWMQGIGARKKVLISIPVGLEYSNASGDYVEALYYHRKGESYFYAGSNTPLKGELPTKPGNYWISLENRGDAVYFWWANYTLEDDNIVFRLDRGQSQSINISFWNYLNYTIEVNLSLNGDVDPVSWLTLSSKNLIIVEKSSNHTTLTCHVPISEPPKEYGGYHAWINVSSPNSTEVYTVDVIVEVSSEINCSGAVIIMFPETWVESGSGPWYENFTVCNNGDNQVDVTFEDYGDVDGWITASDISNLNVGECSVREITMDAGANPPGLYVGTLRAIGTNGECDESRVEVTVT